MTDALVLCVRCMRFACETPLACAGAVPRVGDCSEALMLSYSLVFAPRPADLDDRPAPSEMSSGTSALPLLGPQKQALRAE
jgi:hypothetical protein